MSPEKERVVIKELSESAQRHAKQGDVFHLITCSWWNSWLNYVNQHNSLPSNRPSPIDNTDLILHSNSDDGFELRDKLVEGTHYILLPQQIWKQLHEWYGGGPTLAREVISSGLSESDLSVEVYPLRLHLHLSLKGDRSTIRISKKETVGELRKKACEIFGLESEQACIWDYYGQRKHALINDMDKSLEDVNIETDQDILVDITDNSDYTRLSVTGGLSMDKSFSRNFNPKLSRYLNQKTPREVQKIHGMPGVSTRGSSGGLTGLLNLGNTCYMNSAIQCLVHTPEFASYFLDDYHQEINRHNRFGKRGKLAVAFGNLLRKLWAPGQNSVNPGPFKAKLGHFAPQFSGLDQHDSQELLVFLLDGLHEDLNRVENKSNIESRDADGRPDEEVADEYWSNHVARNNSIIVDVCQGQYKSTLVCPVCNKMSVIFDPFMYLSLPLQFPSIRTMTVTVFTCDGSALPAAFTVQVPKLGHCRDLIQALSSACSLKDNEKILLVEIQNHLINCFLEDPLVPLSSINDDDHLAAYRIPNCVKNVKFLQLIHRRAEEYPGSGSGRTEWKSFGTPLVSPILCDDTVTRGDIHSVVHTMLSPLQRTENSRHADVFDTSIPVTSDLPRAVNCSGTSTDSILGESKQESGNSKVTALRKLPLILLDEDDSFFHLSVGEEEAVKIDSSSRSIPVFLVWSQKLLDYYETTYLENLPVVKNGAPSKKSRKKPLSLYTCLEAFLREEPLVPEDMWYCPQCKKQRQASKKLDLWRLPDVLVIHLKRFSYSRSTRHKLKTFVHFPIHNFNLTNYIGNKRNSMQQLYELYAVINHYGDMGSGHYTAHIKLLDENRWYNFDDTSISPIDEDEVHSRAAYVLFYRRVKADSSSASNRAQSSAGHNNVSCQQ